MCYHCHAQHYKPLPPAKPVRYSLRKRHLVSRLVAVALVLASACITVYGVTAAVGAMYNSQAQLDAAHLQGMHVGATLCARS